MHIKEIIDLNELDRQVMAGNVVVRKHPEFPALLIANYTDQVAFKRDWNDVTRTCRGLIWNEVTGEVLARPFPKFHNWDEPEAPRILDDQVVWHWDNKYDGSLGIMYPAPDNTMRIATRGSFASEQAKLGTRVLDHMRYPEFGQFVDMYDAGYTPLFEIVGPSNRIVLRYDEDRLVPLGYIHIATGVFMPYDRAPHDITMRDLLGHLSRPNAEGWVVWLSNTKAVKIKQADYIELHRMVSNLTEKEVWRQLRAGTYDTYVKELPDELYQLAEGWADGLRDRFIEVYDEAHGAHYGVTGAMRPPITRKKQALWIQEYVPAAMRGLVFGLIDGKDISDSIWRMLEPKATGASDV